MGSDYDAYDGNCTELIVRSPDGEDDIVFGNRHALIVRVLRVKSRLKRFGVS